MTLPYLKGWGDTLAETLPQIGNSVSHIVNPNIDFQNMFKAAIAKDPTLLQQIANNPGLAQALQQSGLGNIGQQTQGLGVDPSVAAQRGILQAQNQVSQGTIQPKIQQAQNDASLSGSQARVAQATEQSTIDSAKNAASLTGAQAKLTGTKADEAERDFKLAGDTLSKIPTLAGIDIGQLGNALARGDKNISAELMSRIGMDAGATEALKLFTQAAINRADNAASMTIAELRKKDPGFQLAALTGLEKQIDDITNQIKAANNTVNSTKPKDLGLIRIQARSKDPDVAGPAIQTLKQYDEALKVVNDHAPGSLAAQWTEANAKRSIILGGLGNVPTKTGGETSIKVKTSTPSKLTPADINQYKAAYKGGKFTKEVLQSKIGNGLSQDEYDQIVGGNVNLSSGDNLNQLSDLLFGNAEGRKKKKAEQQSAQTQANLNVLLGKQ